MHSKYNLTPKINNMSFGQKLKRIRKEKHLNQGQMCELLNMEQSSYSRYETDKTFPSLDVIKRAAEVFDVSVEWLIRGNSTATNFNNCTSGVDAVRADNYYAIPKDVIDTLLNQQKMLGD
jgi:transcriptional regulator with XRE-family HTH domain